MAASFANAAVLHRHDVSCQVMASRQSVQRSRCSASASCSSTFFSGKSLYISRNKQISSSHWPQRRVTTMGLFGLGVPEIAVIAGIAVLVFGPSKLPELGKELGKSVKSFQTAAKEFETELKKDADDFADEGKKLADSVKDSVDEKMK